MKLSDLVRSAHLFTIVTISYERRFFLERYLEYCGLHGVQVILADGSDKPFQGDIPDNVEYFHRPGASVLSRMAEAIDKVQTPYMMMHADDDFVLPSGIQAAIDFLESHPDYVSAQGQIFQFNQLHRKSRIKYKYINTPYIHHELEHESAGQRIQSHLEIYTYTFYSLQRTAVWKRFTGQVVEALKDDPVFNMQYPWIPELVQSIHCVASGRHQELSVPWMFREHYTFPHARPKCPNHKYEFNQTAEFSAFMTLFSGTMRTLLNSDENYVPSLDRGFQEYTTSLTKPRKRMHNAFCDFAELSSMFAEAREEANLLLGLIENSRDSVVSQLNQLGYSEPDYWYDVNWQDKVVSKFETLVDSLDDYLIHGAGIHTEKLLASAATIGNLIGISDKNEGLWGKQLQNVPCTNIRELLKKSNNIIVSSQVFEKEMAKELRSNLGGSINVFTLY